MPEDAVRVEQFLAHRPERVWRALTDPAKLAAWLMPNDFEPAVGHRFTFRTEPRPGFDGTVHCEVLDLQEPEVLRISWRGGGLDTTVTWTLVPEGRGTRLFLEHAGFDPGDETQQRVRRLLDGGWRSHVLRRLEEALREPSDRHGRPGQAGSPSRADSPPARTSRSRSA